MGELGHHVQRQVCRSTGGGWSLTGVQLQLQGSVILSGYITSERLPWL